MSWGRVRLCQEKSRLGEDEDCPCTRRPGLQLCLGQQPRMATHWQLLSTRTRRLHLLLFQPGPHAWLCARGVRRQTTRQAHSLHSQGSQLGAKHLQISGYSRRTSLGATPNFWGKNDARICCTISGRNAGLPNQRSDSRVDFSQGFLRGVTQSG